MEAIRAEVGSSAARRYPPFAEPARGISAGQVMPVGLIQPIQEFLDELAPIEDFLLAELPSIDAYVEDEIMELSPAVEDPHPGEMEYDAEGWAIADWQSFNWAAASALGLRESAIPVRGEDWSTLDWSSAPLSGSAPPPSGRPKHAAPSADEVARALDQIARRIRSGELVIDEVSGTPPEAAMAAALAALLRMRD